MESTSNAKKITTAALLAALALIFSYIEVLIPFNFGIPGIKLGIANLVVIIALYYLGAHYALLINLSRIFIGGLLFSGLFGALYSLAGALLSMFVMILLKKNRSVFSHRSFHSRWRRPQSGADPGCRIPYLESEDLHILSGPDNFWRRKRRCHRHPDLYHTEKASEAA